ncbi:MAG TPA: bifunctional 4-hydroxy-2-oxoglutarate aldolase/2-dehydro-3-deoxy-phosphogluconate aldolase [Anaerovoracaceae bacterium]|nr:bifunctional 4-hydroxy-2-oxoglutarate aldolase/2-dehydro-3-deoxy-phosphogluconate aldolase [Anaerovoracaceae bacterium]
MNTKEFLAEHKVIAICRKVYGENLLRLAEALCGGGVRLMEVTFDQADPDCLEKTSEAIRMLSEKFAGELLPGAGTVLTSDQVQCAANAGAKYIISPNTSSEVITGTKKLGLISIPGAMTPTEIITANDLGADFVKLFPSGYLGFKYIKDILAPISHVKLVATGGVTEENLPEYLKLGFAGAGISGRLCDKALIADGNYAEIKARAMGFAAIAAGGQH